MESWERITVSFFNLVMPGSTELDAEAIARLGLKATIFPEMPGASDIQKIAAMAGAQTMEGWAFDYAGAPEHHAFKHVNELIHFYHEKAAHNLLLCFDGDTICIWIP